MRNIEYKKTGFENLISIKADCTTREIRNFWNHIHFHPTDAIEDDWGKYILDHVSSDGAAQYIRIYAMLEDIVSRGEKGNLTYDFCATDYRLDYLVKKGFRLLICFNFLPTAIAADPQCISWLPRYKGKHINTSRPRDYKEWQEICRIYTIHLKERYGETRLSNWYFHCWNEPDFPNYFLSDLPRKGESAREQQNMLLAAEEYTKLYDHFAEGVTSACGSIKIGGPSAALSNQFIELFLQHVMEGTNHANGKKGTRLDFLSIHTYGAFPEELAAGRPIRIEDTYKRVKELEELAIKCGIKEPEIIVDEWGLSTEGFTDTEKYPVLEFRNTELYAAGYAHLINYYTRKNAPVKLQMICLSGQHNLKKEFHGYRSFFTLHGFPKPIYNAYALCAKLGNRLLECEIPGEDKEPGFVKAVDGFLTGFFPTIDENGRIAILLYRFFPNPTPDIEMLREKTAQHLRLEFSGLHETYHIRHYCIDHENCNAYTAWKEMGEKNDLSQTELEWIRRQGRLKLLYPEETQTLQDRWQLDIVLAGNTLLLIELEPVKPIVNDKKQEEPHESRP